jgi:hypothetical protein
VERAQKHLQLFDEGLPEGLFYAAFELRMGIEARLFDGLDSLRRANGLPPDENITKYNPRELFNKIAKIDENALQPLTLTIGIPGGKAVSIMQYMPVTKTLAEDWGRMSQLLHYTFFADNPDWYAKRRLKDEYGLMSLADYRDMLGDIARRLEEASSGDLIAPPTFIKFFDELNKDRET